MFSMQDNSTGGFRPYDPSKGSGARPAALAPMELKREPHHNVEVRAVQCNIACLLTKALSLLSFLRPILALQTPSRISRCKGISSFMGHVHASPEWELLL